MPVDQMNTSNSIAAHEEVREFHRNGSRPSQPNRKKVAPGQLLISGKWRDSLDGSTMASVDPTTEETITNVARATTLDADAAVQAANKAFEDGPVVANAS